jgi:dUTPase
VYKRQVLVDTGLKMASEAGAYVFPTVNANKSLFIGPGVIDPDYRGEVKVIVTNLSSETILVHKHQHIAELVFVKPITNFEGFESTNLLPCRSSPGAVGYDVHSAANIIIQENSSCFIETGVTIPRCDKNLYPVLFPRSGFLAKGIIATPVHIENEAVLLFHNTTNSNFVIEKNTRVAQIVLFPKSDDENAIEFYYDGKRNTIFKQFGQKIETIDPEIVYVDELSETARGTGGFGSTGV